MEGKPSIAPFAQSECQYGFAHGSMMTSSNGNICRVTAHLCLVPQLWWRHQMVSCSTLLALCAGHSPVTDEFLAQRSVTRSFDVVFDLCLNKRLSKQWWGWWFETPSCPLWNAENYKRLSYNQRFQPTKIHKLTVRAPPCCIRQR